MVQITRFYLYKLDAPAGPINLSVNIGNMQAASSALILEGVTLQSNLRDSFTYQISDPTSLSGKQLDISTTIADVNPDNDDVSYRFKLSGGQSVLNPPTDEFRVAPNSAAYVLIKIIFA